MFKNGHSGQRAHSSVTFSHSREWDGRGAWVSTNQRRENHPSEGTRKERTDVTESVSESENPAIPSATPKQTRPKSNRDWWPNQLDLSVLHQHSSLTSPMGEDFNYAEEF